MSGTTVIMRSERRAATASAVGEEIKRRRELLRLTQPELAEAVGISQQYLSQIERGLKMPSPEKIDPFARCLKVPPYTLRVMAGYSGMDAAPPDDRESELVAAYRRADEAQREQVLRVVRALLGG